MILMAIITYIDDGSIITNPRAVKKFLKEIFTVRGRLPDSWEDAYKFLENLTEYVEETNRYTVKQATAVSNLDAAVTDANQNYFWNDVSL